MTLLRMAAFIFAAALGSPPALAADIRGAAYDPVSDTIVVEIAYRGTNPRHDFEVVWGECGQETAVARATGRLIDAQGMDEAREPYRVNERVSLEGLPCRPAMVTLRLGPVSHMNVYVPEREGERQ